LSKIESGPDYIIAEHAFVKARLRLGLQASLVTHNNNNNNNNNINNDNNNNNINLYCANSTLQFSNAPYKKRKYITRT